MRFAIMIVTAGCLAASSAQAIQPVAPYGKCQNWQSRCAVAAGGTCDGVTGRWRVSERLMTPYLECVSQGPGGRKK
jgi:hypothetical protein